MGILPLYSGGADGAAIIFQGPSWGIVSPLGKGNASRQLPTNITQQGVSMPSNIIHNAMPLRQDIGLAIVEQLRLMNINNVSANQATSLNSNNRVMSASHRGYLTRQSYIDRLHDNGATYCQVDLMESVPQVTTSALTRTPNLTFRYRPPGVPPKTLDAAL